MNLGDYYPARFDPPFWPPVIALIVPIEKSDLSSGDVDEAISILKRCEIVPVRARARPFTRDARFEPAPVPSALAGEHCKTAV